MCNPCSLDVANAEWVTPSKKEVLWGDLDRKIPVDAIAQYYERPLMGLSNLEKWAVRLKLTGITQFIPRFDSQYRLRSWNQVQRRLSDREIARILHVNHVLVSRLINKYLSTN